MSGHGQLRRSAASSSSDWIDSSARAPSRAGGPRTAPAPLGPSRRARSALPLATVGAGMAVREVSVRPTDVVFVKGLVEASDGLAAVFSERGGELLLATPHGREAELAELLADLEEELGACIGGTGGWQ